MLPQSNAFADAHRIRAVAKTLSMTPDGVNTAFAAYLPRDTAEVEMIERIFVLQHNFHRATRSADDPSLTALQSDQLRRTVCMFDRQLARLTERLEKRQFQTRGLLPQQYWRETPIEAVGPYEHEHAAAGLDSAPAEQPPASGTMALDMTDLDTPAADTPAVNTPAMATPAMNIPAVATPVVNTPVVNTPVVNTPVPGTPAMATPAMATPAMATPAMATPAPEKPAPDMVEISAAIHEPERRHHPDDPSSDGDALYQLARMRIDQDQDPAQLLRLAERDAERSRARHAKHGSQRSRLAA